MLKYVKNNYKLFLGIIIGFIISCSIVYADHLFNSGDVKYDNTLSNLESDNVQDAIDELYNLITHQEIYIGVTKGYLSNSFTTLYMTRSEWVEKIRYIEEHYDELIQYGADLKLVGLKKNGSDYYLFFFDGENEYSIDASTLFGSGIQEMSNISDFTCNQSSICNSSTFNMMCRYYPPTGSNYPVYCDFKNPVGEQTFRIICSWLNENNKTSCEIIGYTQFIEY